MLPLFHRDFGGAGNPPLVILHGLLGSSRNWQTVGTELSTSHHVLAVDLRNHGLSPHAEDHDYAAMERDLARWFDDHGLEPAALVGHSMGGKLAMAFACHRPDRVERLAIVDIAPRDYEGGQIGGMLEAMARLDLAKVGSRLEAESRLHDDVPDWGLMKFLATNLERDADGRFSWRVNVKTLRAELAELARSSLTPADRYGRPTLFVVGGRSVHVRTEDHAVIRSHFPAVEIVVLPEAGHNPHIEQREKFVAAVREFLG